MAFMPDLRNEAKDSDANVTAEMKVAERWTLPALEDAPVKQAYGQHLGAQGGREGIRSCTR